MANKDIAVYSAILKMDEQEDGTLMVYGKATDPTIDSDEQICDPTWLKTAMPEWFRWGNVREQHGSTAAGVATEYKADGDSHMIGVHVVDAGSVAKVKAGVLKGFSIGIRGARVAKDNKAAGGRIIDGQIVEVSLVDRPANPSCTLVVAKTIGSELTQVEELAELQIEGIEMSEEIVETVEVVEVESVEAEKSVTAIDLVETAKTIAGDLTKFDQASFDMARIGLARLIAVEAAEMEMGSDETDSLACLFAAVHALFEFHQDEAADGEALEVEGGYGDTDVDSTLEIELSDEAEVIKDDSEIEMCDKCDKEMKECKCDEGGYTAEEKAAKKAAKKSAQQTELRNMIIDVVKTLLPTEKVGEEITKSAESERIEALVTELEQVKALAAPSNVKRMGSVSSTTTVNGDITKAQELRAKATATTDRVLAQGYLARARELENNQSN